MGTRNQSAGAFLFIQFFLFALTIPSQYCAAIDTLTQSQVVTVGQTLISSGQMFELGFFSPSNSSKQYVGMWYKNASVRQVVWVANRENPLAATDSAVALTISQDGNLILLDGMRNTVWSTNVSVKNSNNSVAVLSDNGDFTLIDNSSGLTLWESFNYPSDTLLSGMMLGVATKAGEKRLLNSWLTEDDPSPGNFVGGLTQDTPPQAFIWNGSKPYWRGGPWDGYEFIGINNTGAGYANGFSLLPNNQMGSPYLTFNIYNASYTEFLVITPVGYLKRMRSDKDRKQWFVIWETPGSLCDTYGVCGPFGVCNKNSTPICECLKGFVPNSIEDWSKGNWTRGCVRRAQLACEKNISSVASRRAKTDGFLKLSGLKLPDHFDFLFSMNAPGCQPWCLSNCSCVAYAYVIGIGCLVWAGDLTDIKQFSTDQEFFLRLAQSELGGGGKETVRLIIIFTTIAGVIILGAFAYGLHRWKANRRDAMDNPKHVSRKNLWVNGLIHQESSELPIFDFKTITVATNNFSDRNKLGGGGFGSVYKGMLEDGQEIAVKRLSSNSGQGTEEFKNEIILISKLQHRNLVRLLGYCIEEEEKLLIYEYLTNKSLDASLFGPTRRAQLDWSTRFNITQGVARGLLYLHRDSSLKIIHRDLKSSNILLDKDMNPKISDFGLARTFQVTQELLNTQRVVGTYGYMSPEYALGGIFSEKSDIFSFGVLLLEIVSSKKNNSFHHPELYLSLLGYAWKLWNEEKALDFMDQELAESCVLSEVMRCMHIGLLCVQDHATDRPTMPVIVQMLTSDAELPQPKQPTFTFQPQCNNQVCSINEVTISMVEGR